MSKFNSYLLYFFGVGTRFKFLNLLYFFGVGAKFKFLSKSSNVALESDCLNKFMAFPQGLDLYQIAPLISG